MALSLHLYRFRRRSYTAEMWIPSHSTTHIVPEKTEKKEKKKKDEKDNIQNLTYSLPKCASVTNLGDLNVVLWGGFTQACEIWVIAAAVWKQIATDGEKNSRKRTRLRDLSSCATGSVASPLAVL